MDIEFVKQFSGDVEQDDIEWMFMKSMLIDGRDHILLRDDRFGIQKEQYKKSVSYFIDDLPYEFSTISELLFALNEKIKRFRDGLSVNFRIMGAVLSEQGL